jgi:hypothetical protein
MAKDGLRQQDARCHAALDSLEALIDWQTITTIHHLCRIVGHARSRVIFLEGRRLPPPLAGLSCAGKDRDYIFYADDAAQPLQEHTILHELAHILLDMPHTCWLRGMIAEERQLQLPLPSSVMTAALNRSCYDEEHERMAEMLASLIAQRWHAQRRDGAAPLWLQTRADLSWIVAQTVGQW